MKGTMWLSPSSQWKQRPLWLGNNVRLIQWTRLAPSWQWKHGWPRLGKESMAGSSLVIIALLALACVATDNIFMNIPDSKWWFVFGRQSPGSPGMPFYKSLLRTSMIWKSGCWWVKSRSGWLYELLVERKKATFHSPDSISHWKWASNTNVS